MKKIYSITQRRYTTRLKKHIGWPELIGLVDIFFICMLCFVFSTSKVRISGISVNIPQTTSPNFADVHKNVISVTKDNANQYTLYFKDKKLDLNKLDKELSDLHSQGRNAASVILLADKNIPYEFLTQIMSKTAAAKVTCFLALMPSHEKEATLFDNN
jgi:biopolymer transport protein ExbD